MSQAFSATHRGFSIDLRDVKRIPDKEKDGKCFTEYDITFRCHSSVPWYSTDCYTHVCSGAGKISVELAKEVQENIVSKLNKPRNRASGLQIRIAGCKGGHRFSLFTAMPAQAQASSVCYVRRLKVTCLNIAPLSHVPCALHQEWSLSTLLWRNANCRFDHP